MILWFIIFYSFIISSFCCDFLKGPHHLTTSYESLFLDETSSDESFYDDNCDDDSLSEENSCGETSNDDSSNGGCSRDDTLLNVHNLNLDDDRLFEKKFLDNKFNIRDDVHKKLRRWTLFHCYLDLGLQLIHEDN